MIKASQWSLTSRTALVTGSTLSTQWPWNFIARRTFIEVEVVKRQSFWRNGLRQSMIICQRMRWERTSRPITSGQNVCRVFTSSSAKPEKVRFVFHCVARCKKHFFERSVIARPWSDFDNNRWELSRTLKPCSTKSWWNQRSVTREMEEYRMVRHLFGATSSPSVWKFCVRKAAEQVWTQRDTVKHEICVDDMKVEPWKSKVVKWCQTADFALASSNDRQVLVLFQLVSG